MGYRFRFRALHRYREYLLKREQIALAQIVQRLESCEREREQARLRLQTESSRFEQRQCEGMGVPDFLAWGDRIRGLEQHLLNIEQEAFRLRTEVESARRKVMERERDLKALSILEEREWESYLEELKKHQQGQIDEFAILGRNRKKDDAG